MGDAGGPERVQAPPSCVSSRRRPASTIGRKPPRASSTAAKVPPKIGVSAQCGCTFGGARPRCRVSWATPRRPLSHIAWHPCHPACGGRVTRAASALNQAVPLGLTSFSVMPGAHSGWPRATKPWLFLPEAKPGTSKAGWELEASRGPCGVWTQPASAGGMWGGVTTGPQTESETPDVEGAPLLQHQCPRGPESPICGEALGFRERPGRGDAMHRTSRKK